MLQQLREFLLAEFPEDKPNILKETAIYLQGKLNATFLHHSGKLKELQNSQHSEAFILGFIQGCEHASSLIDYIQFKEEEEDA